MEETSHTDDLRGRRDMFSVWKHFGAGSKITGVAVVLNTNIYSVSQNKSLHPPDISPVIFFTSSGCMTLLKAAQ